MTNPNRQLAEEVVEALIKQGLIQESDGDDLLDKLLDGSMHVGDWLAMIERGMQQEGEFDARGHYPDSDTGLPGSDEEDPFRF